MSRKRIGIFPKDKDSIMTLIPPQDAEFCFLVAKDSNEAEWVNKFLKPTETYYYDASVTKKFISDLNTIDILQQTDLLTVLNKNDIKYLYLDIATQEIEDWSIANQINLIITPYKFRKIYENKILFDNLLAEYNIPKPRSSIVKFEENTEFTLPFSGKTVLQKSLSSGGEGTFFIDSVADIKRLIATKEISYSEDYLLREYIPGTTYGITVFVAPGHVALSSIRLQCFAKNIYQQRNIFLGVQWVSYSAISAELKQSIEEVFASIGDVLYKQHFFGFANFDFQVDVNKKVYLIECNARFSSATVQYLKFHELMGGVDIRNVFLETMINSTPFPKKYIFSGYPNTEFAGSSLKVNLYLDFNNETVTISKQYPLGLYSQNGLTIKFKDPDIRNFSRLANEFIYYSDVVVEQKFSKFGEIARIVSNYPLFTLTGALNDNGNTLLNHFEY